MFHPLHTASPPPQGLNNPFAYEPHPACIDAFAAVHAHIGRALEQGQLPREWGQELRQGKMLGVLICRNGQGELGFLAAYSGQLGGRADWPWFVPAVFDYLQPSGYFRQEEARITAINRQVEALIQQPAYTEALSRLTSMQAEAQADIDRHRRLMQQRKAQRDAVRAQGPLTEADQERLLHESQHLKAELRRLKTAWNQRIALAEATLQPLQAAISTLKNERRRRSDALQRWLFQHIVVSNSLGQRQTMEQIFAPTPQRVPPSGAGECCAPKLFDYAFRHHLVPLFVAEQWVGASPRQEVRHHGAFYPACRGKCKPILAFMLQGLSVPPERPGAAAPATEDGLQTVYADRHIIVVVKPAGMLSVPGRLPLPSVSALVAARHPQARGPMVVHRLDMDTSGLMVLALTAQAHQHLQRQFAAHTVEKRYVALLETELPPQSGTISLPLRPDPLDRPRQVVDDAAGHPAVTRFAISGAQQGHARATLQPLTGRTHQLRVHCAHPRGLATPILGDPLYGRVAAPRLYLHAAHLAFRHPATGLWMSFESEEDWS